jgi:hypothetical protein
MNDCYVGIDTALDGSLVMAERRPRGPTEVRRFPSSAAGLAAVRSRVARAVAPRVCVAAGTAGLAVALALGAVPRVEVMLRRVVAPIVGTAADPAAGALALVRVAERAI